MTARPLSSEPGLAIVITAEDEAGDSRAPVHTRIFDALEEEIGDARDVEVILADGRGGPGTARPPDDGLASLRPWLRIVRHPGLHRGALRNVGVRVTTAPLLLFLSDDVVPTHGSLAAHRELQARGGAKECVGVGRVLFPTALRADAFRRWLEDSGALFGLSYTHPDPRHLATFFHGANTSIPRGLLERAGPFREDFGGPVLDDDDMGRRLRALGATLAYVPNAVGLHEHAVTLRERRLAVRGHGRAAVIVDGGAAPGGPWPTDLTRSTAGLYARAVVAGLRSAFARTDERRARFYRRLLAADFARGYREERARAATSRSEPG